MEHCASLTGGRPGVLHGNRTYLLQDDDGQIADAHSISAGLDYPGIGPEHAWLHDSGRVDYVSATDTDALDAFQLCSKLEGIIPALEPSHALAYVLKIAPDLPSDHIIVMNMCGRGDKDMHRKKNNTDGTTGAAGSGTGGAWRHTAQARPRRVRGRTARRSTARRCSPRSQRSRRSNGTASASFKT